MTGREFTSSVPIEHFIQSLTSQLDRAQTAMAMKARAGLPLTFAVKDLSIDLRAHVEVDGAVVKIRPAGPGDAQASTLHFALTTITRPMMEENTMQMSSDPGEPGLQEVAGDELSPDELRRLEWAGVQTVSQLVNLREQAGEHAIERIANVPALRLRAALERASRPMVRDIATMPLGGADATATVRMRGHNLMRDGAPSVTVRGEQVPVLRSRRDEVLLAPLAHQMGAEADIEIAPGVHASVRLPAAARAPESTP